MRHTKGPRPNTPTHTLSHTYASAIIRAPSTVSGPPVLGACSGGELENERRDSTAPTRPASQFWIIQNCEYF